MGLERLQTSNLTLCGDAFINLMERPTLVVFRTTL